MNGGIRLYLTITTSKPSPEQLSEVKAFLHQFLPRVQQQPGVVAVYHYVRPDKGDDSTLIIWESEAAVQAYRTSALVKEAIDFEQAHNLPATREGYPLSYPL
jgi:quinol monooxygenase YgiN